MTLFCAGNSLFLGYVVTQGAVTPMILGLLTLTLLFTLIESHPRTQALRTSRPAFKKAMNGGIIFRCLWSVGIMLTYVLAGPGYDTSFSLILQILKIMNFTDIFIGMGAIEATQFLTSIDISQHGHLSTTHRIPNPDRVIVQNFSTSSFAYQFAVYLTTIITGLIHTTLLALLCATFYVGLVITSKIKRPATSISKP